MTRRRGRTSEFNSTCQLPSGSGRTIDVRYDRLNRRAAEGAPGLRIEPADLADHVDDVFVVDAADFAQRREIALGDEFEMADERLHGRIETIFFAQLNGQAFGEIAGADAGRIEGLNERQDLFDAIERCSEPCSRPPRDFR